MKTNWKVETHLFVVTHEFMQLGGWVRGKGIGYPNLEEAWVEVKNRKGDRNIREGSIQITEVKNWMRRRF